MGQTVWTRAGAALLVALGLLYATAAMAQAVSGPDSRIERVSIVVGDISQALTLYRDALGLEPAGVIEHTDDSFALAVFGRYGQAPVREVLLTSVDRKRGLGLVEINAPHRDDSARTAFWIEVGDFDNAIAKARELGVRVLNEKRSENSILQPIREQVIVDWYGNRVVVYSLVPEEVISGDCIEVGELVSWHVFDDRQIYIEGAGPRNSFLVTMASRCRGALYARLFEIPNETGRLCRSDGRIAYRDAGLRRTCRIADFEAVPDLDEAARRATSSRER